MHMSHLNLAFQPSKSCQTLFLSLYSYSVQIRFPESDFGIFIPALLRIVRTLKLSLSASKPFLEVVFKSLILWYKSNTIYSHFSVFQYLCKVLFSLSTHNRSYTQEQRRILSFWSLRSRGRRVSTQTNRNMSSTQQPTLNRIASRERRVSGKVKGGYSKRDILIRLEAHSSHLNVTHLSHITFSVPDDLQGSLKASCYYITQKKSCGFFPIHCRIFQKLTLRL